MIIKLLWIENADKVTLCEKNSGLIDQLDTGEGQMRICKGYEVFMPESKETI